MRRIIDALKSLFSNTTFHFCFMHYGKWEYYTELFDRLYSHRSAVYRRDTVRKEYKVRICEICGNKQRSFVREDIVEK